MEELFHSILTSSLQGGEWSVSGSDSFTPVHVE